MGRGDTFGFYAYASDNTQTYAVKLSAAVAAQGGFTSSASPTTEPVWPYHADNMRHVWGKNGTQRARLPIQSNATALYTAGGTFTLGTVVYVVEGIIGEKRKLNCVS